MTSHNVILSQPDAKDSVSYTLPEGETTQLNFAQGDISGLRLGDNGELVISFEGGGQMVVSNFDEIVGQGEALYLSDGTYVDPSVLTSSFQAPNILPTINFAANDSAITISQPTAQTSQEVTLNQGQKYVCDFNPANAATVEIKDGKMTLTFADGSQVVLNNYSEVMAGELPPELTLADGSVVNGEELLTETTDVIDTENLEEDLAALAELLAEVQPAAGEAEGKSNSGYGFNSSPTDVPLISPDAVGPLGATALRYLAPQVSGNNALEVDDRPEIDPLTISLDETGLGGGNLIATGTLQVDYGNDGPGEIVITGYTSVTGSLPNNILSSAGVPIVITPNVDGDGYEGYAGGTLVFTFEIDARGNYHYEQYETFDHADSEDHNDVVAINFGVKATDADGDISVTNIRVQVADDAPVIFSQIAETIDETGFVAGSVTQTGQFYAGVGQDANANAYSVNDVFNPSGSLAGGALTSQGVAVTVSAAGNVYTGVAGGVTVFTLTLDTATGGFVYQQFAPLDHGNPNDPNDVITLKFGVEVTDFDGDHADGLLTVHVMDDAPEIFNASESLNEQDLSSGPIVETGSVDPSFGTDGWGEVTPEGTFTATGSMTGGTLSHDGVTVVVTETANGYTGVAGGVTVFTLEIDPATGQYTYTQFENLDHADVNDPNDVITLTFGVQITDFDGDIDTSNIVIDLVDGAPIFQPGGPQPDSGLETVDETNMPGPLVESGQLQADFGGDDPGRYEGVPTQVPTGIMSEGNPVTVTFAAGTNTFTGMASGVVVYTLALNSATGEYTYTQFEPLDHPNSNDHNDLIQMEFGVNAIDSEGDTVGGSIVINVRDDGPDAVNDFADVREGNTITGNVLSNDDAGADGLDQIVSVMINGDAITVPTTGSVNATGQYGTLTLNANGNYSYTPHNNDPDGIDSFTYVIRDGDGDVDEAVLSIDVSPDMLPIDISGSGATDDTNLRSGNDVETGTINVNYQGDIHEATTGNGNFSAGGSLRGGNLTHNGNAVNVSFDAGSNTYTGVAGGVTVFTMNINTNGTYRFVQREPLDHGDNNSNNEAISLRFGVIATDTDGDTGTGTVTITVRDDGPTARNDSGSVAQNANGTSGNVLGNDDAGQDGGASVTTPGSYNGNFGTLTINANGTYSYARFSPWTGGSDSFNYTMRDGEGDTASATLTINVTALPVPVQNWGGGDGGDGGGGSPLVFDLDGDGIELVSTENGVLFDMGSDGDQDLVAWVGADDGLLAMDVNGDGVINDQSELFGTLEVDGFHVLAEHDSNNDGVIDAKDAVFNDLRIWQDANQDGISQEGELTSLADRGIASINLGATSTDYYMEGSWVAYESTFTYEDGTVGQVSDVWFKYIDEGNWNRIVEVMGEEAATDWLKNAYSTVTQFIPSEVNDTWEEGDPLVLGSTHKVFEVGLNDSIVSQQGELTVFYNGDEPGATTGNGDFQVGGSLLNGGFSSHGEAINVTYDDATGIYFGSTEGELVFNLQINSDGTYTFNLFDTIDHGNDVNLDDNILMQFGVTVTDGDGDGTDSSIRIQLRDAGSYLEGDVDGITDTDSFNAEDLALFQAIGEATETMADLQDISMLLDNTDEVTGTIQDFVYAQESETPALEGDANAQDVPSVIEMPQSDLADLLPETNALI